MGNKCITSGRTRSKTNDISTEEKEEARNVVLGMNTRFITVIDYGARISTVQEKHESLTMESIEAVTSGEAVNRKEHHTVRIVPKKAAKILLGMRFDEASSSEITFSNPRRVRNRNNMISTEAGLSLQILKREKQTRDLNIHGLSQHKDELGENGKTTTSDEANKSRVPNKNYEQLKERYRQKYKQLSDELDLSSQKQDEANVITQKDNGDIKKVQFHVPSHQYLQHTKSDPLQANLTWPGWSKNNRYSRFSLAATSHTTGQRLAATEHSVRPQFKLLPPIPSSRGQREALPVVDM